MADLYMAMQGCGIENSEERGETSGEQRALSLNRAPILSVLDGSSDESLSNTPIADASMSFARSGEVSDMGGEEEEEVHSFRREHARNLRLSVPASPAGSGKPDTDTFTEKDDRPTEKISDLVTATGDVSWGLHDVC